MSKSITIKTKDGQAYKLEFTRKTFLKTIAKLKESGIGSISELTSDAITAMAAFPDLFEGAFLANHSGVSSETVEEILKGLPNKEGLTEHLMEMFLEPLNALTDMLEENEDSEGNVMWEVSE